MREQKDYAKRARVIVGAIFAVVDKRNERAMRQFLHISYPFGERKGHAYRVWLREVRAQCAKNGIAWRKKSAPREQLALFRL